MPGRWLGPIATLALMVLPAAAAAQEVGIPLGTQAPPADVQNLAGDPLQLLDLFEEGKPTLVEFWATWCEVCAAIQPELDSIQAKHGERLNIIAVAVGVAQTLRRVNRHLEEHDPGYAYVWDANGAAVRAYEAPVTAAIVLMDGAGRVVHTGVGEGQNLMERVEELLGGG